MGRLFLISSFSRQISCIALICIVAVCCSSCRHNGVSALRTHSEGNWSLPVTGFARDVAVAMSSQNIESRHSFTQTELERLQQIRFTGTLLAFHVLYRDQIVNIDECLVRREFLDMSGAVSHSELIRLEPVEFWEPIRLLALVYKKHGIIPVGTTYDVAQLKWLLEQAPSFGQ